jgi:cytochrome b6-f complex iron-sulfur subunit
MINQEAISRKEFLMKIGFSGAALMAALTSCGGNDTVTPISAFTVDLSASANAALKTVGGYIKTNGVVLARIATGDVSTSFAAIARICPHEQKDKIVYNTSKGQFHCTEHDWYFKTNGTGVGNGSITAYTISLSGTTLSIS